MLVSFSEFKPEIVLLSVVVAFHCFSLGLSIHGYRNGFIAGTVSIIYCDVGCFCSFSNIISLGTGCGHKNLRKQAGHFV